MLNAKQILLFVTCCLAIAFSIAQPIINKNEKREDNYRAIHWGIHEGMSQGETYQFLKDVYGFLWIGTKKGLNRFDGNKMKIYFHDPQNSRSIGYDGTTMGMVEDSLHNIWIATNNGMSGNGLSRYDIKADTFTNFHPEIHGSIEPFMTNKDEVWCIENDSVITSYNIHSYQRKVMVSLSPYNGLSVGSGVNNKFFDAKSNSIWSLSNMPGDKDHSRFGLLQIFLTDGRKEFYNWPCYRKIPNHNHESEAMRYDKKRNCIWINSNDGLVQFTMADKKFYHIKALNELPDIKNYLKQEFDLWHWVGIDIDTAGRVWIATVQKGIVIYNPNDQSVRQPFTNDPDLQKEISDYNVAIYCDRDGVVWTGSWQRKGVYQLNPFSAAVKRFTANTSHLESLSENFVLGAMNADDGKIWFGSMNGLNIFDPLTGSFKILHKEDLPGMTEKYIKPAAMNLHLNKAWVYTGPDPGPKRTFEMDLLTKKCREIIYKDSAGNILANLFAMFIIPYKEGALVTVSSSMQQTIVYELAAGNTEATPLFYLPAGTIYLFPKLGFNDQRLYVKALNNAQNLTYNLINDKWIKTPSPLDSINWNNNFFYNKRDETYWVAANHQLIHFDKDLRLLKQYTKGDGIPVFDIQSIICDDNNNPWFNTDRSIHQLNLKTGTVITLSEKDGFQSQNFSGEQITKVDNGDLYFPAGFFGTGFDRVSPSKLNSAPSSVYLESLEVNQKPFSSTNAANSLQQLSLRYFENKITIETGVIDYYSKGTSGIRYKLEGGSIKNAAWQYAPSYYTIRYEELPPGEYTLSIQAGNAGNDFNGPIKTLLINISPAFWNTWWFRTIALLFLVDLIYSFVQWRTKQKFKLKLERSEKERELSEIKQKATMLEMQALRAQMNPHFIFNSLNSINRFILQNNRQQASEYLTKFSKLVRLILQNSQASLISLESELEALNLYLDLEALRFDHRFGYKISVPKDLDVEVLKVPPLIIQPYTENAIWHGLMHKEDKGELDIEISQEEDHLFFKISDNGIGRKKAAEMASKSATKHKSMGLRITKDRIAMLQKTNGAESPVKIIDLENPDGSAAGTEVIIKMPLIYD